MKSAQNKQKKREQKINSTVKNKYVNNIQNIKR